MTLPGKGTVPERNGKNYKFLLKKFNFFISCSGLLSRPHPLPISDCGFRILFAFSFNPQSAIANPQLNSLALTPFFC
jgi:hypothetical protein